ncbi:heterokaryon incompatibility protein [Thozetella sp. PMI_491]|nr:heterokaryon incompatibility protein [Thozetella sp. PMI_491]
MKISPIALERALVAVEAGESTAIQSHDFYSTFGTSGCCLSCDGDAGKQSLRNDQSCNSADSPGSVLPTEHLGPLLPSTVLRWATKHHFTLEVKDQSGIEFYVRLFNIASSRNTFRKMPPTSGHSGDTSSSLSLQRARRWVEECVGKHLQCGSGIDMPLPTRIIDVRPIHRDDTDGVKLLETSGLTGTYACLSHCWGKVRIDAITKTETLPQRLDFIPWSLLPRSFQHAVLLTRELGVQYLWIDSMCIIQDDKADWEREAARMVHVYRNAYVTIANTWSPDSQGGSFSSTIPTLSFRLEGSSGKEFLVGVGIGQKRESTEFDKVQDYFPLFNRGWCFQERLLSRRVLHCNYGELAFDCGGGYLCECGGREHFDWHNVRSLPATYAPLQSRSKYAALLHPQESSSIAMRNKGSPNASNIYRRWQRVVAEYTCLNLTVTSDMLPALSGLAKETAELINDTFLAGLWKGNLENDLLWYVESVAEWRARRHAILARPWAAPSWTWAATGSGCKVNFFATSRAKALTPKVRSILDAEVSCTLAGTDPTGAVSSGRLEATAPYLRVMIQRPCSQWIKHRRWTDRTYGRFQFYCKEDGREWHPNCRPTTGETHLEFGPAKSLLWVDPIVERLELHHNSNHPETLIDDICKWCAFLPAVLLYMRGLGQTTGGGPPGRTRDFFMVAVEEPLGRPNSFVRIGLSEVACETQADREDWFGNVWNRLAVTETPITIV